MSQWHRCASRRCKIYYSDMRVYGLLTKVWGTCVESSRASGTALELGLDKRGKFPRSAAGTSLPRVTEIASSSEVPIVLYRAIFPLPWPGSSGLRKIRGVETVSRMPKSHPCHVSKRGIWVFPRTLCFCKWGYGEKNSNPNLVILFYGPRIDASDKATT